MRPCMHVCVLPHVLAEALKDMLLNPTDFDE